MRRTWLLILLAVAGAALVAVPAVGLAAVDSASTANAQTAENDTAVAPGERMSGVVGVGEAEISGNHQQRAFGLEVAQAQTEDAQADAVADRLTDVEQRLDELEQRRAELEAQREAGEISEGRYRAEIARIAAQTESVRSLGNQTGQVAGQLPTDLLEQRNVTADRIQQISTRASNLAGPEVAEIARGIAGNNPGEIPDGPPVDLPVGPDDDRPRGPAGGDDRPGGPQGDDDRSVADDPTDGNAGEQPDGDNATEVTPDADADTGTEATADDDSSVDSDTDADDESAERTTDDTTSESTA